MTTMTRSERPACHDCGTLLSAPYTSCSCGWRSATAKQPMKQFARDGGHAIDKQCAFDEHGTRCASYGSVSNATSGEGPWYCSKHFWELRSLGHTPSRTAEQAETVRMIRDLISRKTQGRQDASRVDSLADDGQQAMVQARSSLGRESDEGDAVEEQTLGAAQAPRFTDTDGDSGDECPV